MATKDKDGEDRSLLAKRRKFFDTYFRKGAEFTQELLHDNEALRFRVIELEEDLKAARSSAPPSATVRELLGRIEELEKEKDEIVARSAHVERLNRDFDLRYREIERENNDLANLYIASSQLHAALDLRELCATVIEILLNFVGAKVFALLFLDEEEQRLGPLVAEGIDLAEIPSVALGDGIIGETAASGTLHRGGALHPSTIDLVQPAVCIPLSFGGAVVGVIPIWAFLAQKQALVDVDVELFRLLSGRAAPALNAARCSSHPSSEGLSLAALRGCLAEQAR